MELAEQVGYGKGKCLVQSVQKCVSQRDFVKEEGDCVLEKIVTGILLPSESLMMMKMIIIIITAQSSPRFVRSNTQSSKLSIWCTLRKFLAER
jgi:hypothetical protein